VSAGESYYIESDEVTAFLLAGTFALKKNPVFAFRLL